MQAARSPAVQLRRLTVLLGLAASSATLAEATEQVLRQAAPQATTWVT